MEICRLCSQSTNVFNLFLITDTIKSKLSQTFKIKLKEDDSLPKSICQDCNDKLDDSFNFFMTISYVQSTLSASHDEVQNESQNVGSCVEFNVIDIKSEQLDEPAVKLHELGGQGIFDIKMDETKTEIFFKTEAVENASSPFKSINKRKYSDDENSGDDNGSKSFNKSKEKAKKGSKSSSRNLKSSQGDSKILQKNSKVSRKALKTAKNSDNGTKILSRKLENNTKVSKTLTKVSKQFLKAPHTEGSRKSSRIVKIEKIIEEKISEENQKNLEVAQKKFEEKLIKIAKKKSQEIKRLERLANRSKNDARKYKKVSGFDRRSFRDPSNFVHLDMIYESELLGNFTAPCLTLEIPDTEKLENGKISAKILSQFDSIKWSNQTWKCDECHENFENLPELNFHLYKIHKKTFKFYCEKCGIRCQNFSSYATHFIKYHESNARFSCLACSEIFWNLKDLHVHQRKNHEKFKLKICVYCGLYFNTAQILRSHLIMRHNRADNREEIFCDFCNFKTKVKEKLNTHMAIHKKYSDEICEFCGMTFKRSSDLTNHVTLVHEKKVSVDCEICGKNFKSMYALRKHKKETHNKGPKLFNFVCHCGKKFEKKHSLKYHQISHDPNGVAYKCQFCERGFKYSSGFVYHMRSAHTNEKPYVCPCCELRFFDYPNANKHIKGAHGSDLKPFKDGLT